MADAPVLGAAGKVKLDAEVFGARFSGPLVHETVRAELNARRRGTAATRTRSQVRGGGAKPWRQKGTGRARAGSNRSPLWAGGAVVFGPQPRSYTVKVNRKERRAALRSALSLHAERGSLAVLDPAGVGEQPSAKTAATLLRDWGESPPTLVVLGVEEATAALSFRNLARVSVRAEPDVGVADIVGAASLLVSRQALDALGARARGTAPEAGAPAPATAPEPASSGGGKDG
ncbi:MAG: 50S ribosomal protein L4 [Actinobacteria bacterium]|nr:MAG: 50S ribosomal protein L4 [Actinomycetota bacterium]